MPYVGMKMYRTATVHYRTASVLIAYEYRTKVCLVYLQRIWTSWRMPDDRVTYLTYNLRDWRMSIVSTSTHTVAIRRVRWSYTGHTQSTLVIHWSYPEYAGHTQSTLVIHWSYAEYAGHTLVIPRARWSYAEYAGHTLVIRRVRWSYTGHTQSTLVIHWSYAEYAGHTLVIRRVRCSYADIRWHLLTFLDIPGPKRYSYATHRFNTVSMRYVYAQCSSVVRCVGSIVHGGPIELFLVPASAPRLVQQRPWYVLSCLWDSAYKRILAANRKE